MIATSRSRVPVAPLVVSAALLLLEILVALATPAPTLASCALPPGEQGPRLEDYEIGFVGTVIAIADGDRVATVAVEEIWRGPDLPAQVTVKGGFGTDDMWTSVDRTFENGRRYLFALHPGEDGTLQDDACSSTAPWSDDLAALRPADARTVAVTVTESLQGIDLGPVLTLVLVVLAVAGTLIVAGLAVRGREA